MEKYQRKQSPWADAPEDKWKAEFQDYGKNIDRNLLVGVCEGDEAFFNAHPRRTFRLRSANPHESRCCGGGDGWMLIAKASGRKYAHFPMLGIRPMGAPKHNSDEVGRYLFDCLTYECTAANTEPSMFAIIEEIRGAR